MIRSEVLLKVAQKKSNLDKILKLNEWANTFRLQKQINSLHGL